MGRVRFRGGSRSEPMDAVRSTDLLPLWDCLFVGIGAVLDVRMGDLSGTIRLAVVEDEARVREGLVHLINTSTGCRSVASCPTAENALARLPAAQADLHHGGSRCQHKLRVGCWGPFNPCRVRKNRWSRRISRTGLALTVLAVGGYATFAEPVTEWIRVQPFPTAEQAVTLLHDDQTVVALCDGGVILRRSSDGTWQRAITPTTESSAATGCLWRSHSRARCSHRPTDWNGGP
jgi:hypothetical protein